MTILGTLLAAVKTVVTNRVQVGRLKLHPLDLLLRMSPIAFLQTILYSYMSGELSSVQEYIATEMTTGMYLAVLFNGILAFMLNVVSFTANKQAGPVTMTVAGIKLCAFNLINALKTNCLAIGNVKQVLSIVLAIFIFKIQINATNAFGILLTLFGGAYYAQVDAQENRKKVLPLFHSQNPVTEESMLDLIISEKGSASGIYEALSASGAIQLPK